tara:strand:- start:348 stop:458 length:111 start_codon:yes stop_codon:yes gene_type:complete
MFNAGFVVEGLGESMELRVEAGNILITNTKKPQSFD